MRRTYHAGATADEHKIDWTSARSGASANAVAPATACHGARADPRLHAAAWIERDDVFVPRERCVPDGAPRRERASAISNRKVSALPRPRARDPFECVTGPTTGCRRVFDGRSRLPSRPGSRASPPLARCRSHCPSRARPRTRPAERARDASSRLIGTRRRRDSRLPGSEPTVLFPVAGSADASTHATALG